MPFEEGHKLSTGRPKGSPNKTTQEVRDAYQLFAENNLPKFQKWIDDVAKDNPAKAMELVLSLSEYFIPKLQRTETDVTTNGESISIKLSELVKFKDD